MTSRVRPTGASNGTPWNPSMTCGPDAPMPLEPPVGHVVQACAVIAISVGVRVYNCRMPYAIRARVVHAAT